MEVSDNNVDHPENFVSQHDFSLASKRYGLEEIKRDATGGIVFTL